MRHSDQQLGAPLVEYTDTKANIEALTGISEGAHAYATDTDEPGWYDGAVWQWGSSSLISKILTDDDGNVVCDDDGDVVMED